MANRKNRAAYRELQQSIRLLRQKINKQENVIKKARETYEREIATLTANKDELEDLEEARDNMRHDPRNRRP